MEEIETLSRKFWRKGRLVGGKFVEDAEEATPHPSDASPPRSGKHPTRPGFTRKPAKEYTAPKRVRG